MQKLEPQFCETCPGQPLGLDEEIVQVAEKINDSAEHVSGVMGMFAKTHLYHREHVPATGNYEVMYRGPLRGLHQDAMQ